MSQDEKRKSSSVQYTDKVKEEIARRREQEAVEKQQKKENVSERMKKLAEASGTAPGFSTAILGAQIAAATAGREGGEKINVKEVAKNVDKQ